ncbi:hypothetical protein GCM10011591_42180 [Nocardia camponoti]|uniref:Uncharacterized protein n=1 Tax=Nocardia camponoti TaxID=1616106 RepID=A0A917VDJ9_9NOCA|nr:hypothetical protein GCM10011591_42180 [Nocardia camponoti]
MPIVAGQEQISRPQWFSERMLDEQKVIPVEEPAPGDNPPHDKLREHKHGDPHPDPATRPPTLHRHARRP